MEPKFSIGSVSYDKKRDKWQTRIRVNGKRKHAGYYETREEAEAALGFVARSESFEILERVKHDGLAVVDVKEDFFKWLDNTERQIDRTWWKWVERSAIANRAINSLETRDFDDVLKFASRTPSERTGKVLSASSLNNLRTLLSHFGEFLYDEKRAIKDNWAKGRAIPREARMRNKNKEARAFLKQTSIQKIRTCIKLPQEVRNTILFAIGSGLRQDEQWSLKPSNFFRDEAGRLFCKVWIKQQKWHTFPVFGLALEAYESQVVLMAGKSEWLFPNAFGKRRKGPAEMFERWMEIAEIEVEGNGPFSWHSLRKTCITGLQAGWFGVVCTPKEVQDFIGHATSQMTNHYTGKLPETVEAMASRFGWSAQTASPSAPIAAE